MSELIMRFTESTFNPTIGGQSLWISARPNGNGLRASKNKCDTVDCRLSTTEESDEEQRQRSTWTLLRSCPGCADRGGAASQWRWHGTWSGLRLVDRHRNRHPEAKLKLTIYISHQFCQVYDYPIQRYGSHAGPTHLNFRVVAAGSHCPNRL